MTCEIEGCPKPSRAAKGGLCAMHQWRRLNGRPLDGPPKKRFGAPFETLYRVGDSGCWEWLGAISRAGYGRYRKTLAHRYAYELHVGRIPPDLQLDHLCRNRSCCNPEHLEPVTGRTNTLRGETITAANAAKAECVHGHPFDAANTGLRPNGHRWCRACARGIQRRYAQRKAASA